MTNSDASMTSEHTVLSTRLGDLTIVRDREQIVGLYFPHHWYMPRPASFGARTETGFEDVTHQLVEYLAGERQAFELPLRARGDAFQRRVWDLLTRIPYGQTTTYGDLAKQLGGDVNAQQVGVAVGRNPVCILIPCHRVIGSTGKLTGYAGGLDRKRALLELEQSQSTRTPAQQALLPGPW